MTLAFLFPGQGSQSVGMGQALADGDPAAREAFEIADRTLGFPISRLCWNGPPATLTATENAQPALLTASVAALRALRAAHPSLRPSWTAGHSLGEYSACVAAEALAFEDALRLVRRRGELMRDADPAGLGTMAAVLGVDRERAQQICDAVRDAGVLVPANLNAPGQVVLSGDRAAIEAAEPVALGRFGASRYVRLEVSGAFHSPRMEPAREALAVELERTEFREPRCPVITNVDARPAATAAAIRDALVRQLTQPVRWEESMRTLIGLGTEAFLEIGNGRVLRGLLRGIDRGARCAGVDGPESVAAPLGAAAAHAGPTRGGALR